MTRGLMAFDQALYRRILDGAGANIVIRLGLPLNEITKDVYDTQPRVWGSVQWTKYASDLPHLDCALGEFFKSRA